MWLGTYPYLHNRDPDAAGKMQGVIPIDSLPTKAVTLNIESQGYEVTIWFVAKITEWRMLGCRCGVGSEEKIRRSLT